MVDGEGDTSQAPQCPLRPCPSHTGGGLSLSLSLPLANAFNARSPPVRLIFRPMLLATGFELGLAPMSSAPDIVVNEKSGADDPGGTTLYDRTGGGCALPLANSVGGAVYTALVTRFRPLTFVTSLSDSACEPGVTESTIICILLRAPEFFRCRGLAGSFSGVGGTSGAPALEEDEDAVVIVVVVDVL